MLATTEELKARFVPQELHSVESDRQVLAARFSPCGGYLIGGDFEGRIRRWSVSEETPAPLEPLEGHQGWVQAVAFHPTDKTLYSGDSWGKLASWLYADEKPSPSWSVDDAHDGWLRCLSVSHDGKLIASCGVDRAVRIWSTADGVKKHELTEHQYDVMSVRFHPGGKFLVSGDARGVVKKWDVETGKCVGEFDAGALHELHRIQDVGGVHCLAFDEAGKTLACSGTTPTGGGNVQGVPTVLLFDFAGGKLQHTLSLGASSQVYAHDVHLHRDGFVIAVTSGNPGSGQFVLHRAGDEQPFFTYTKMANCHSLSMHPDGKRVAIVATNKGSNGNGRRLTKDGEYAGNTSPIHIFALEQTKEEAAAAK